MDRIHSLAASLRFSDCLASENSKIWLLWRHGFQFNIVGQSDQFVHAHVTHASHSNSVFLTGVYAKSTRRERGLLWADILDLSVQVGSSPWLVGGDFNAIASLDEYRGPSSPDLGSISDFSGFIHQGAFLELPTSGGFHTWTGIRGSGRVHKKLDRLLFNSSWISAFSSSSLELLSKATSDHCPLLLKVPFHSQSVPKPFKFQSMWIGRHDFQDVVRRSWAAPLSAFGMLRFSLKLKRFQGVLRDWNRLHFGDVHANVKNAEADLRRNYFSRLRVLPRIF